MQLNPIDTPGWPAAEYRESGSIHRSPALGFLGAKGGVGTTLLCTSLAWSLAHSGLRVVVLDYDLEGGLTALHLCDHNAGPTLHDALQALDRMDPTLLQTLLTPAAPRLQVLPAPRPGQRPSPSGLALPADALGRLLATARQVADAVLVDLPRGLGRTDAPQPWLQELDRVALITQPTLQSTYAARCALDRIESLLDGSPLAMEAVLNMGSRHDAMSAAQVRHALQPQTPMQVWRELPRSDATVQRALHEGRAVGEQDPRDPLSRRITEWAIELKALWGRPGPDPATTEHAPRRWLRPPLRRWIA